MKMKTSAGLFTKLRYKKMHVSLQSSFPWNNVIIYIFALKGCLMHEMSKIYFKNNSFIHFFGMLYIKKNIYPFYQNILTSRLEGGLELGWIVFIHFLFIYTNKQQYLFIYILLTHFKTWKMLQGDQRYYTMMVFINILNHFKLFLYFLFSSFSNFVVIFQFY